MGAEARERPSKTDWYLEEISSQGETSWMIPVDVLPFVIGREEKCHLPLKSKWISRSHAQIHAMDDTVWIMDLGSTNGTYVNRKRIDGAEMLKHGDVLRFANRLFRLHKGASSPLGVAGSTAALESEGSPSSRASLESELRQLISQRAVIPYFQPIVSLSDLQVRGYEILGRTRQQGLPANPAELFEIASYAGCASELSALFREEGLRAGRALDGSLEFFVNSCPAELYQIDRLEKSLRAMRDIAPSRPVVLEVNEKSIAGEEELGRIREILADLKMGLAYEDFGVGQTRLVELARTPPDFLKFDASIVRNIHLAPPRLHQMVVVFVNAARDLGITTIAEGIENQGEVDTCRQLGFEYVQGYLYGRPVALGEMDDGPPPPDECPTKEAR